MLGNYSTNQLNHNEKIRASLLDDHRAVDNMMMKVLLIHWIIASTVMGMAYGMYLFGFVGGALICAFAYTAKLTLTDTPYCRIIMATSLMLFSAIFIQQNLGRIEMHFHIFASLAILARYKDILPIISAITVVVIHHFTLNYCQSIGITIFDSPLIVYNYGSGLSITLVHGVFAASEAVILSIIIYQITRQYCENLNTSLDNSEVIATLNDIIAHKKSSNKVSRSNKYAHLVNDLLDLMNSNTSLRNALDNASVGLILTDNKLEIIDCSSTVAELFADNIQETTALMPDLDFNNPAGASIKPLFDHADTSVNLATITQQARLKLALGNNTFYLIVNPLIDKSGAHAGLIIELQDHTSQQKIENEINRIVEAARMGDLSKRINVVNKEGFFERLNHGINDMITIVNRNLDDIASTVTSMSHGDLSNRVTTQDKGKFAEVRDNINNTLSHLDHMVLQIKDASSVITVSSHDINDIGNNLLQRSESQSASLEETAASLEEMTSAVRNNAQNAKEASDLSSTSTQQAAHGGVVVKQAIEAMHEINDSSNKIAKITNVIDEIAFQTNLLALNAAVEAARAGEQGRGFAVVATEVRNLAQRSATAAKEIKNLIGDSVNKITTGNDLVEQSGKVLEDVVMSVSQVNTLMLEIASANHEQSLGIEQINAVMRNMDGITQENTSLVHNTTHASTELFSQANKMNSLMSFFSRSDHDSNPEQSHKSNGRSIESNYRQRNSA